MNFLSLVFSKILNFSSQRDVQAIKNVFNLNLSAKTKIMCSFCIDTFDRMDKILFNLNKVPWYDSEYSVYGAAQFTFERITLDELYRVRFRTLKAMQITDFCNQIEIILNAFVMLHNSKFSSRIVNQLPRFSLEGPMLS